jgi:[ribosomal protein S5]-alanine N-acetyltransferase
MASDTPPLLPRLVLPDPVPTLRGERLVLRAPKPSDIDDRLRHPIDPEEEDGYGGSWRRAWAGERFHSRERLAAPRARRPDELAWGIEHRGGCIGGCALRVDTGNHRASYSVGIFVRALRGIGLGREATRLVVNWGFRGLGLHRVELEVLTGNERAIRCYESVGFRREGIRREAELYPDGWKDFLQMGMVAGEWAAAS